MPLFFHLFIFFGTIYLLRNYPKKERKINLGLEHLSLNWNMFEEKIWSQFGLILFECQKQWNDAETSSEDRLLIKFFKWTIPALLNTAESLNLEKFRSREEDYFIKTEKKEDSGFYSDENRPPWVDANVELIEFLKNLSGKEKFELLTRIFNKKKINPQKLIHILVSNEIGEMYTNYLLDKSLKSQK